MKLFRSVPSLTLGAVLSLSFLWSQATAADTASGKLTINGKTVQLTHVYALAEKGIFDSKKEDVKVLLTDVAVPDSAIGDDLALNDLAQQGKLHGIQVTIDSDKQPVAGQLYHTALEGSASVAGMHKFTSKTFDGHTVAGTLAMEKPDSFMGVTFQYSATFDAQIRRAPAPTATGSAAADSAPGKVATAYYKAAAAGNVAALKQCVVPEMAKQLDGSQGKDILEMLKMMTPANIKVIDVTIAGTAATVTAEARDQNGSMSEKLKLVLLNGQWKVTQ